MGGAEVAIGPTKVPVWPKESKVYHLDPMLCVVSFPDNDLIRSVAEKRLLEAETQFRDAEGDRWVGAGGAKIRDIGSWPCPAMNLLHMRAKMAFKSLTGAQDAHIDDCWANVSRKGEYLGPHSHRRTEVSAVYHLVPPEKEDREVYNGALGISDPRVARCCPTKPGIMTSQIYPPLDPGTLVLFPSFVVHYVTPHQGDGYRISVSWNISREEIPGDVADESLMERSPT
ncbi:MAG: putative 2OG-Fe(II) oxygenase [Alphaproteobacteria bacterium]